MSSIKTLVCNIFCHSDSGIAGSNPSKEINVVPFPCFVCRVQVEALQQIGPSYHETGEWKALHSPVRDTEYTCITSGVMRDLL
jgi:hypothetical protein